MRRIIVLQNDAYTRLVHHRPELNSFRDNIKISSSSTLALESTDSTRVDSLVEFWSRYTSEYSTCAHE